MLKNSSKIFLLIIVFSVCLGLFSCAQKDNQGNETPKKTLDFTKTTEPTSEPTLEVTEATTFTEKPTDIVTPTETPLADPTLPPETKVPVTETPVVTATPKPTQKPEEKKSAPPETEFNVVSKTGLIINEVISSNKNCKKAPDGEYYDIVELYNNSDKDILLSDYYFSDKGKNLLLWKLPKVTLKAQALYVFYAVGEASGKSDFAPFSISNSGEKLYLSDAKGNIIDAVEVPEIPTDMSFGRNGDAFVIYKNPTVGAKNQGAYFNGMADKVTVSVVPGIYSGTQTVTLAAEGATIYYTTDGSRPTYSSTKYSGESINISKTLTIRAFSAKDGYCDSSVKNFTYFIKIPSYELDVISVSVNPTEFANMYEKYSEEIEIEAGVSYFSKGICQFSENCGIEINGQTSQAFDKKSFKLSFKSKYGTSKLKYRIFENSAQTEFDRLVLRSGGGAQASYCAYINDEFFTSIVTDSKNIDTVYSQLYKPVNVYINGEYWGLYFIREKVNADFVADKCGVSASSVAIVTEFNWLEEGTSDMGFRDLWKFICEKDLTVKANYDYVAARIDLKSVADYYILEAFSGNYDASNVRIFKSTENDGKWRFIFYDLDYSFGYKSGAPKAMLKSLSTEVHDGIDSANALIYKLLKNPTFKTYFLERLELITKNELSVKNLQARWDKLYNLVHNDMKYNIERWTGHECEPGFEHTHDTMADWERVATSCRNTYLTDAYLADFIKSFKEAINAL